MDMQGMSIDGVSDISSTTITTGDLYAGTSTIQNLSIQGKLDLGGTSMIYINGIMVNPSELLPSPILDPGYETRITQAEIKVQELEKENNALRIKLEAVMAKVENIALWEQV